MTDFFGSEDDMSNYSEDYMINYHIPIDIAKYTKYNKNTLQLGVVYFEVVEKSNGEYYYINNPFKGIKQGTKRNYDDTKPVDNIVYVNKYGDDLDMGLRLDNVIFLRAYDVYKEDYEKANKKETDFLSIPGIDADFTDLEEEESDFEGGSLKKKNKSLKKFHFLSSQKHQNGGKKTVRNVTIKNGKGHKKVTYYNKNKKISTIKKPLKSFEIEMIKKGKFIPGLFKDCIHLKKRSRKNKISKNE
jgi:hypothetical protein